MSNKGAKAEARKRAFIARKAAQSPQKDARACEILLDYLATVQKGAMIAAYMPIRTEISPLGAMVSLAEAGYCLAVPVIEREGAPLKFSRWTPEGEMVAGPFGASVPAIADYVTPEILITPLVAFDARGFRLGYGGGFYDRTFEVLRAHTPTKGIGFAYDAQEMEALPIEPTDQPLDAVVTEKGVRTF